ncbi:PD-(D/E)XK nuclease family protein [Janibacter anophelis]|uniref:PD-(D/E)XK nuclease family protein n=1 Tax=Janibacter anophelis TaxID=319054 RepID=UPI003F80A52A
MSDDVVTQLLPVLGRSTEQGFNVFDVMHHGLHEKQISNTFRWLLNPDGTHGLGSRFLKIFVDEINQQSEPALDLPLDRYVVHQEVNTAAAGEALDIADLVLESSDVVIVVENYFTSDGHGHNYDGYRRYGERDGRRGVVVLLCRDVDRSLQTKGWEQAPVLTYATLVGRLFSEVSADRDYRRKNESAYWFVEQMHQKFVEGRGPMGDSEVLEFMTAMCHSGEAARYQIQQQDVAAQQFASDLADQAKVRFVEGRELLQQVKNRLKNYSSETLRTQLNETLGDEFVRSVSARYAGIYQWTINFELAEGGPAFDEARLQIKFGPSAWFANANDPAWRHTVPPEIADYSRLFLTRAALGEIRQSSVEIQEVLDGLEPTDRRLHDEIVLLLQDGAVPAQP